MINPRAETFSPKPAYRNTFKHRRCLISAEGFYECQAGQGGKTPFLIRCKDNAPFAMAGLLERWPDADEAALQSCSVCVTEANPLVRWVHNRMPVILAREDDANWLDPGQQGYRRALGGAQIDRSAVPDIASDVPTGQQRKQ
jgi:putative SOS response-associated peptidase YedK